MASQWKQHVVLVAAVVMSPNILAATVFKCVDANGTTTYSQQPCSADPRKVQQLSIRGIGKEDAAAAEQLRTATAADRASADRQRTENNCIANRTDAIWRVTNGRLDAQRSRADQLERQISTARNNLAGATYEAGLRQEIAALHTAMATERASADQQTSAAVAVCRDQSSAP